MPLMADEEQAIDTGARRFYTLAQLAETLATSKAQIYALVRSGELPAIKIGGRGQWRAEHAQIEAWIDAKYVETRQFIANNPFNASSTEDSNAEADA